LRVTLINPPRFWEVQPSLGLLYIASVLEKAGHTVAIVDKPINTMRDLEKPTSTGQRTEKTWERFTAATKNTMSEVWRTEPDVIGMTITLHTYHSLELLAVIKSILPATRIVVGGPQATFMAHDILSDHKSVDFVVRGEGEYTMLNLVQALQAQQDYTRINGLSYRRDGEIVDNPVAPFIKNLDELPYPARHLIDLEAYPEESRMTLISSRGCPHRCIFCASPGLWKGYRPRAVENVVDEFAYLVHQYSAKGVNFVDDTFAVGKDRTIRLCRGIKEKGQGVPWSAMTRVGLGRELLEEMCEAGCRNLFFGCESGDDSVLRVTTKGISTSQIESTVRMALELGIDVECAFVINLPFETAESARTTIEFATKLKRMGASILAHSLVPYLGTEIYNNPDKYNLTFKNRGVELWKIMSHPLYLAEQVEYPIQMSNNLISEQELIELWSKVRSTFDYY
jgi:anaerobic magnesium-protoporphyrin IX monomethyl ester cyclase